MHGPTRAAALNLLTAALAQCQVAGSATNLEFLGALSRHKGFRRGEVDTGLIARDLDALTARDAAPPEVLALAAIGGLGLLRVPKTADPWDQLGGWRHWTEARQYITLEADGTRLELLVNSFGRGLYQVLGEDLDVSLSVTASAGTRFTVSLDGHRFEADAVLRDEAISIFADGRGFGFGLPDNLADATGDQAAGDVIVAPMPGLVRVVSTEAGAAVAKGDALMVLEAMKMEHTLTAPRDGVVAEVLAAVGDQIADGALLLSMAPEDA